MEQAPDGMHVPVSVAAQIAHVQPDTIRAWVDNGRLPATRTAGGHRRIPLDALRDLIAAGPGARRARPLLTDLSDAVEGWVDQLDEFAAWRPPKHLTDDQLARLRADIGGYDGEGGLIRDLRRLRDRIDDELIRRDQAAS